jgi:hypothetical protein
MTIVSAADDGSSGRPPLRARGDRVALGRGDAPDVVGRALAGAGRLVDVGGRDPGQAQRSSSSRRRATPTPGRDRGSVRHARRFYHVQTRARARPTTRADVDRLRRCCAWPRSLLAARARPRPISTELRAGGGRRCRAAAGATLVDPVAGAPTSR